MTEQPPTPPTPETPSAGNEERLDSKHRRTVSAMLTHLGGPPLSRDEVLRFKKA